MVLKPQALHIPLTWRVNRKYTIQKIFLQRCSFFFWEATKMQLGLGSAYFKFNNNFFLYLPKKSVESYW